MKDLDPARLTTFRRALERRLGLRADSRGMAELGAIVRRRARALRAPDLATYLEWAGDEGRADEEASHLAAALTVPETYFFRNAGQIRAVAQELARRGASGRPISVLSAGCATGEEPYTVAMLAAQSLGLEAPVEILGVDVSRAALETARRARYPSWSLRQTDDATRERFFVERRGEHEVVEAVRRFVRFEEHNLARGGPLWQPGRFDVILCRNVLMYLRDGAARALVERIAAALSVGGILVLGDAEALRGMRVAELELVSGDGVYFYRRVSREAAVELEATPQPEPPARPAPSAPAPPAPPAATLASALELLRAERFGDALEALERVADPGAPAAVLLRGALLLARGDLDAAEATGERLLELDRLDALAHHLIALCREQKQDLAGAIEHERAAIYLEPRFALSHLHMGRLLVREGKRRHARRELRRAADLLPAEDEQRFALFGGGLHRAALIELCRAELRRLEGEP